MRVFLAGATGFVGREVLRRLLEEGHEVTGLARTASPSMTPGLHRFVAGDLQTEGAWMDAVAGHDALINAVGILRERRRNTFRGVVVQGTRNLVAAARRHGVRRLLHVSANGIDAAAVAYQVTKLEAEADVKSSGLDWTIFRPSLLFGPHDELTRTFARWMRLGLFPYFGRGDYRLAPLSVHDAAAAIVRSLDEGATIGQTFPLCGPESLTFREFLEAIRHAAGRRCLLVPAPKWAGYVAASLLGWWRAFPADRDNLRMLFQENVCTDSRWTQVLRVRPISFRKGIRSYLG